VFDRVLIPGVEEDLVCIPGTTNYEALRRFNFSHVDKGNFCYMKKIDCLLGGLCVFHNAIELS